MYSVIVGLGNSGLREFARVPDFEAADKLRTAAKKRGFRDAKIVNSANVGQETGTNIWGQTRQESLDWEARRSGMHDLRAFNAATLARTAA
jgi:hypothetical protein